MLKNLGRYNHHKVWNLRCHNNVPICHMFIWLIVCLLLNNASTLVGYSLPMVLNFFYPNRMEFDIIWRLWPTRVDVSFSIKQTKIGHINRLFQCHVTTHYRKSTSFAWLLYGKPVLWLFFSMKATFFRFLLSRGLYFQTLFYHSFGICLRLFLPCCKTMCSNFSMFHVVLWTCYFLSMSSYLYS